MRQQFPQHDRLIYQWDDPVWNAEPNVEDCVTLITAVMLQAVKDEMFPRSGSNAMNGKEALSHDNYLFDSWGLQEDCELVGIDYSKIIKGITRAREARDE